MKGATVGQGGAQFMYALIVLYENLGTQLVDDPAELYKVPVFQAVSTSSAERRYSPF